MWAVESRTVAQHIVLLRGINLGSTNRVSMPDLRAALTDAGFDDVHTYLQSGNVVLSSTAKADTVARKTKQVIADEFGLDIDVVTRTRIQLAKVVERNPLDNVAKNPKRYQVSFLAGKPSADVIRRVEAAAAPSERVVIDGREIYAWHPDGVARSRLWALLAGKQLGTTATARNWTTVTSLLSLAQDSTSPRAREPS
jgi:uncharacterized protein (DUF1697 family)